MLAALRMTRQHQNAGGGGEDEDQADQRFLNVRPAALGPGQQHGAGTRRQARRKLGNESAVVRVEAGQAGHDDAQGSDLGDGQVDEDDAPAQHLRTKRHVGGEYQQAGDEGRRQQAPVESQQFGRHWTTLPPAPTPRPALHSRPAAAARSGAPRNPAFAPRQGVMVVRRSAAPYIGCAPLGTARRGALISAAPASAPRCRRTARSDLSPPACRRR